MRTIPDIALLLAPLEDAICLRLIPPLTGYTACSPILRDLLSLPGRLGGIGMLIPWTSLILSLILRSMLLPLKELIIDYFS